MHIPKRDLKIHGPHYHDGSEDVHFAFLFLSSHFVNSIGDLSNVKEFFWNRIIEIVSSFRKRLKNWTSCVYVPLAGDRGVRREVREREKIRWMSL